MVGYLDADLSTRPGEFLRLADELERTQAQAVLGSRVSLLGTNIARRAFRHYTGRIFATIASLTLGVPVYDTQCGAKVFRASPALERALSEPFHSRWAFDVELLGRLIIINQQAGRLPADGILEVPLRTWTDVGGSTLTLWGMLRAGVDLALVHRHLRTFGAPCRLR